MNCLLFGYNGNSRELKRIIIWLRENVVEKSEIKYMIIYADDESKLLNFLSKNFPQVERIELK